MIKIPPKVEEVLRKGVVVVGNGLEKLISGAEMLSLNIKSSGGSAQPVLSLEGQFSVPRLKELINQAVEKMVLGQIPSLIDKTALELREGGAVFVKQLKEKGSNTAIHVDMGGSAGSYQKKDSQSLRSISSRLPFEDGFFDYIMGLYANPYQGDLSKGIKEFSRILSIAGEGVIIDFHPFGMYAKRGNIRLKPIESTIRGLEDYYKICRAAGLKVFSVRETFFDDTMRPLFVSDEERSAFRMVKDTPLLIYLFVRKGA